MAINILRTESITIGVADTLVLAEHPRNLLILENKDSADNVFVHFGTATATVATGHKIVPGARLILQDYHHEGMIRAIKDGTGDGELLVTHDEDV